METLRRPRSLCSPDATGRDGRAGRRVAGARPGDAEGADAGAPRSPTAQTARGDAVASLPQHPDLLDAADDHGGLPRPEDGGAGGPPMPAREDRQGPVTECASRSGVRRWLDAQGRRSFQPRSPRTALMTAAPIAAAHTSRRVTTHGAQLGSAAGSRRARSGSIRPSHSRTTRSSRWGIRQLRANERPP